MDDLTLRKRWFSFLTILLAITSIIWVSVLSFPPHRLRVIACDVGQGDAFLITHESAQILVDGGPNTKVLDCLERNMPFWDRKLELVVLSHPQADHLNGLVDVFERYNVDTFLTTPLANSTSGFRLLSENVKKNGSRVVIAKAGKSFRIGLIGLDILNPTGMEYDKEYGDHPDVLGAMQTKEDLNDYSVVFTLHYNNFDALFTGDIGPRETTEILEDGGVLDVEYLKIPHHGSRNGLIQALLQVAKPEVAVMSLGENNRFGHPHREVIDLLEKNSVKYLRTDEAGEIVVESDGNTFWIQQ